MHNMIIEDEEVLPDLNDDYLFENHSQSADCSGHSRSQFDFDCLLESVGKIQDEKANLSLQTDLIEHLWRLKGNETPLYHVENNGS